METPEIHKIAMETLASFIQKYGVELIDHIVDVAPDNFTDKDHNRIDQYIISFVNSQVS